MRTAAFFILALLGLLFFYLEEAWLGTICLAAAVVVLLAGFGKVAHSGAGAVWGGIKTDAAIEWKGVAEHTPKPVDASVVSDVAHGIGSKAGEVLHGNERYRFVANKPFERIENGIRSMHSALLKLFKK